MSSKASRRIETLLDSGSFAAFRSASATGYLTGKGKINGRRVYVTAVASEEMPLNVFDGLQHHLNLLEEALAHPAPVVMLSDVPGYHVSAAKSPFPQNPAKLLADKRGIGRWYSLHAQLSGKVPQICVVFEPMGAALTFPVALCDAVVMLENAGMSIGRPDVVEKIIGEKVDYKKLGGAKMHARVSGSVDKVVKREDEALAYVRHYLSFFPSESGGVLPQYPEKAPAGVSPPFAALIPDNPNTAFDMRAVIMALAGGGHEKEGAAPFLQLRSEFAEEVMTGFARINGMTAGIVANNSQCKGGLFFPASCRKVSRFVSLCDAFGIPLVFLADSAGFMVGSATEQAGSIREAALMFQTIANTRVAKLSIVVRRAYTAGVYAMAGPGMHPESFIALPTAVISIYGKAVAEKLGQEYATDSREAENRQAMLDNASDLQELHRQGLIDEIIQPEALRLRIARFLKDRQDGRAASGKPVLLV